MEVLVGESGSIQPFFRIGKIFPLTWREGADTNSVALDSAIFVFESHSSNHKNTIIETYNKEVLLQHKTER